MKYKLEFDEHEKNVLKSALGTGEVELRKHYMAHNLVNKTAVDKLCEVFTHLRNRIDELQPLPTAPGPRKIRCWGCRSVLFVGQVCPKCDC